MTEQETIEAAAKALWNDVCDEHNQWDSLDGMEQSVLRGQAAAAFSTLRPGTILPGGLVVVRKTAYMMLVAAMNGESLSKDERYWLRKAIWEADKSIRPSHIIAGALFNQGEYKGQ